jgi:uncharacterized membrane protein YhhN
MLWQWMIGLSILLALWYWVWFSMMPSEAHRWAGSLVKTGASGVLALGFWAGDAPGSLVLGLTLGAAGDFALSRPGQRWFLAGMASFAGGHLIYAGWLVGQIGRLGGPELSVELLIGAAMILALVASTEVWLAPHTGVLKHPVRGYALVIGSMAGAAIFLPWNEGAALGIWIGAALFVASDLLLSLRLFRTSETCRSRILGGLVWPLYWTGQAMIVFGGTIYALLPKG